MAESVRIILWHAVVKSWKTESGRDCLSHKDNQEHNKIAKQRS